MTRVDGESRAPASEQGQASIVGVGIVGVAVVLGVVLIAVVQTYVARSELQQAADVAAAHVAAARSVAPAEGAVDPHVVALARRNGAHTVAIEQTSSGDREVVVTGPAPATLRLSGRTSVTVRSNIEQLRQRLFTEAGSLHSGVGGVVGATYTGPLVQVDASRVCPRVASAYRAMQASAAAAGIRLYAVSGYRTFAEQARLYATLGSRLAAPPGRSLHHAATELDITVGPAGSPAHRWLTTHASRFGFIQRYSWEPWHWGNVRGC
jgi:hypothetical protein